MVLSTNSIIFQLVLIPPTSGFTSSRSINTATPLYKAVAKTTSSLCNIYDDWRSDAVVAETMVSDEDNVRQCLNDFINSDYGHRMFGIHPVPASYGITGTIDFVELSGPEVVLELDGKFWHRRETVLGRAAVWLNACMPEITEVRVEKAEQLQDFQDIRDELTGDVLYREDKRAPDFNGDRETMEYQGLDPDARGPFPVGAMESGSGMINPS